MRKVFASEAHVNQATHGGCEGVLFGLAQVLGFVQISFGAVIDIRPISRIDRSLPTREHQLTLGHAILADTIPHLKPVVIRSIPVEVAAMSILAWLWRHRNQSIDVRALALLIPAVDLHFTPLGKVM